jgi:hypothetical protein
VGAQLWVAVGLLVDDGADPVVLTGVGGDVGQDPQLIDVRVVFWVEAFYFRMKGQRRSCCRQWSVPKRALFSRGIDIS